MLLKKIGFVDPDAIPWGIWDFAARVLQGDERLIRQVQCD
jgi:hypothetical protein